MDNCGQEFKHYSQLAKHTIFSHGVMLRTSITNSLKREYKDLASFCLIVTPVTKAARRTFLHKQQQLATNVDPKRSKNASKVNYFQRLARNPFRMADTNAIKNEWNTNGTTHSNKKTLTRTKNNKQTVTAEKKNLKIFAKNSYRIKSNKKKCNHLPSTKQSEYLIEMKKFGCLVNSTTKEVIDQLNKTNEFRLTPSPSVSDTSNLSIALNETENKEQPNKRSNNNQHQTKGRVRSPSPLSSFRANIDEWIFQADRSIK
jgi:hypothetical protein